VNSVLLSYVRYSFLASLFQIRSVIFCASPTVAAARASLRVSLAGLLAFAQLRSMRPPYFKLMLTPNITPDSTMSTNPLLV
jgi:hypothetical protein